MTEILRTAICELELLLLLLDDEAVLDVAAEPFVFVVPFAPATPPMAIPPIPMA